MLDHENDGHWLHSDSALTTAVGVTFPARYLGNIVLLTSLTTLDFEARSLVVRECISRVCAAAGQPLKRTVVNFAARTPALVLGSSPVRLTDVAITFSVTATHLSSIRLEDSALLLQHDLKRVSFMLALEADDNSNSVDRRASVPQTKKNTVPSRYVAYVINDGRERLCIVLDCGQRAVEVAKTIGQAFSISSTPADVGDQTTQTETKVPLPPLPSLSSSSISTNKSAHTYFNDEMSLYLNQRDKKSPKKPLPPQSWLKKGKSSTSFHFYHPSAEELAMETCPNRTAEEETEEEENTSNMSTFIYHHNTSSSSSDERHFETLSKDEAILANRPPSRNQGSSNLLADTTNARVKVEQVDLVLEAAPYFHGLLNRESAEARLAEAAKDGSFLVRLANTGWTRDGHQHHQNQRYILSTRQHQVAKNLSGDQLYGFTHHHVLLQQEDGSVTCEGRRFASVSQLMAFHLLQGLPLLTSEGNLLWLKVPVHAPKSQHYSAIFPIPSA